MREHSPNNRPADEPAAPLLRVENLKTIFHTQKGVARAVDGVSFHILPRETVAIVGESGCGKSVTALSILRLIASPPGLIAEGRMLWGEEDLRKAPPDRMRALRGAEIAMVFQDPTTSLNPVFTIGDQIAETISLHQGLSSIEAREQALHALRRVQIPDPTTRIDQYPHQMSGGMRQRVMIAMALCCYPRLLIADEPTTALDVTVQAQILNLLRQRQEDDGTALLLITHDLGVVAKIAHRVLVMYAGQIVESATTMDLFQRPRHPYTAGLFRSAPRIDTHAPLTPIEGMVPDPVDYPLGCRFHPRCPWAIHRCAIETPPLRVAPNGNSACPHLRACWLAEAHPEGDFSSAPPPASPASSEVRT